jgi:ankyrin repeat protein
MSIRRTSRSLLALLALAILFFAVRGQAAGDPPLVTAAKNDDLQAVRAQLTKGANVNAPGTDGSTALLWSTYNSNIEMTRTLLAAASPVNTPNHYGITPLLQASRAGDAPLIALLLKAGADAAAPHPDGSTSLMAAARTGHLDAVKLLLDAGADPNKADTFQEQTALMWAAAEGHVDVVKALVAAGADPNRRARLTTIEERKHGDHPTGGFTALMFAARNGHEAVAAALVKGGADLKPTNGDGLTATMVAIANDWFDLAKTLIDLGSDPNDGSLYFAVDMHDATTDMRAHDGSRLRASHANTLTSLDLVKLLLDKRADANKPFVGQVHSTTLCCAPEVNSSPFFRAATASDVEVLKVMLAHGAKVEWTPAEVKKKEGEPAAAGGRGMNANVGKTPVMMAMAGGRGAPFGGGPGFSRVTAPPFREPGSRDPVEATTLLLKAGANPSVKAPDGSTPLHQAVQARQVGLIRALVAGGAKLDAVNKENLTPLQLAEKPEAPRGPSQDQDAYQFKRNTRDEVIAALRELMKLGPDDPTPMPPPLPDAKKPEPAKSTQ